MISTRDARPRAQDPNTFPLYTRSGEFLRQIGVDELRDLAERKAVTIDHFRKGRRVKRVTLLAGEVAAWPSAIVRTVRRSELRVWEHNLTVCLNWNRTPGRKKKAA